MVISRLTRILIVLCSSPHLSQNLGCSIPSGGLPASLCPLSGGDTHYAQSTASGSRQLCLLPCFLLGWVEICSSELPPRSQSVAFSELLERCLPDFWALCRALPPSPLRLRLPGGEPLSAKVTAPRDPSPLVKIGSRGAIPHWPTP